jgi:hypothetical protein
MQPTEHPHPLPRSRALCDLPCGVLASGIDQFRFTGEPRGVTGQVIHLDRVCHALTPASGGSAVASKPQTARRRPTDLQAGGIFLALHPLGGSTSRTARRARSRARASFQTQQTDAVDNPGEPPGE